MTETGTGKVKGTKKTSASRAGTRGTARDGIETAAPPTGPTLVTRSSQVALGPIPRPEKWPELDLADGDQWHLKRTRQEYFSWLPERLGHFLDGCEAHDKDFFYWKSLADFLRSKVPFIDSNEEDVTSDSQMNPGASGKRIFNDNWKAHRLLGSGGFGRVTLWVKRDAENQIVDEMAIKETKIEMNSVWLDRPKRLAKEAVLHHHLNRTGVENFVQLRGYKEILHAPPEHPGNGDLPKSYDTEENRLWRFYLEFAPYGELSRLIDRYRAWNRYLPEAFLWHVFDSLALALLAKDELPTDPDELPTAGAYTEYDRVLHFDIKPDNIFLGYEQPFEVDATEKHGGMTQLEGETRTIYPIIKLGDFGIAELVGGKEDEVNPKALWGSGTRFYKAPEMTHYGVTWRKPPNGTKRYREFQNHDGTMMDIPKKIEEEDNPGLRFGPKLDLWSVGKVC